MNVGILGSGMVGQTIGARLAERGVDVVLGTRTPERGALGTPNFNFRIAK